MVGAVEKLIAIQEKSSTLLSVGLDPHFDQLPDRFKSLKWPQFEFNKWIIDQTCEYVSALKPQFAAYEALGSRGWRELEMQWGHIHIV